MALSAYPSSPPTGGSQVANVDTKPLSTQTVDEQIVRNITSAWLILNAPSPFLKALREESLEVGEPCQYHQAEQ